jgi:hypothetical protein
MLPFLLPLWETDATLRAGIQESVQASVAPLGSAALLSGGSVEGEARATGPRAAYLAELYAEYAHALDLPIGGGAGPPSYNLDSSTSLSAVWTTAPRSTLALETEGSLATTYGVRADTQLIELDPFLFAQRLEYAFGHTLVWSHQLAPRTSLSMEGGYLQAGALAAESIPSLHVPAAVGVDTHEAHAALGWSRDLGPRDSLSPELRYTFTHYQHALLDTRFDRGPADVHAVTLSASETHELARGLSAGATAGFSIGNAMPLVHVGAPVVAPDAGLTLRWIGRRARLTARASYAYTSLGPRIGFGQEASARLKLDLRPSDGSRYRDMLLHGSLRFAHGAAPLAADPEPILPGVPVPPATGTLTTTTLAAAMHAEIPLRRGLALTTGSDLALVRGVIDPAPVWGQSSPELLATITIGLTATISTDKRRTVPRDPEAQQDEEARRIPVEPGASREEEPPIP